MIPRNSNTERITIPHSNCIKDR